MGSRTTNSAFCTERVYQQISLWCVPDFTHDKEPQLYMPKTDSVSSLRISSLSKSSDKSSNLLADLKDLLADLKGLLVGSTSRKCRYNSRRSGYQPLFVN